MLTELSSNDIILKDNNPYYQVISTIKQVMGLGVVGKHLTFKPPFGHWNLFYEWDDTEKTNPLVELTVVREGQTIVTKTYKNNLGA